MWTWETPVPFSLYSPFATVVTVYVIKPNAIPNDIEEDRSIMIIVKNTEATIAGLSQSISLIWTNIRIPTVTNAAVVTDGVNKDKTAGAKNTEIKNKTPTTTAVRPVLPPRPIPVALST